MEIRIENSTTLGHIEILKAEFDKLFSCDFNVIIERDYVYFRDG